MISSAEMERRPRGRSPGGVFSWPEGEMSEWKRTGRRKSGRMMLKKPRQPKKMLPVAAGVRIVYENQG